jgi:hypothetical protein
LCQPVTRSAYPKFHRRVPSLFERGDFRCEGAENGLEYLCRSRPGIQNSDH